MCLAPWSRPEFFADELLREVAGSSQDSLRYVAPLRRHPGNLDPKAKPLKHLPEGFRAVVKKFRGTDDPLIQGKNLVLSSGAGIRHESRFPQIRYLVAAMIL